MKGYVPTPETVVDLMVEKLFWHRPPTPETALLDPGCGQGAFIAGVIRWCTRQHRPLPAILGIDSDPQHARIAADRFAACSRIRIHHGDFLRPCTDRFDYIIGNPPYVPITSLTIAEREAYRTGFAAAKGRFDLYLLFFEQALSLLGAGGRLVFITPEKFLYVDTARPLREIMGRFSIDELHFLDEQTFDALVTYPLVSTLTASPASRPTRVVLRDGATTGVRIDGAASWLPLILGADDQSGVLTLADICTRVSCGVATGADSVFTVRDDYLDARLRPFAHPTIAGRQIIPGMPLRTVHSLLVPYALDGSLLAEGRLGSLGLHLADPERRRQLLARTCVTRKPWYAFHETPPLGDLLRPKLLCKDIGATPFFVPDRAGAIVPRHSVYYAVPIDPQYLDELAQYLNSPAPREWLRTHCQRAANGFLRMQSQVLKRLPVPEHFRIGCGLAHREPATDSGFCPRWTAWPAGLTPPSAWSVRSKPNSEPYIC